METDPRFEAFCSPQGLDIFHAITHQSQIWQPDPYDVETIHTEARSAYERLLARIDSSEFDNSGRILLLLGESGAGKTHLMRVFRNQTHEEQRGFFSYMQMTSAVGSYARYVLRNTLDSFDKPYCSTFGSTTGLLKFSNALAEDSEVMTPNELALLREDDLSQEELVELIYPIADRIIAIERFSQVDIDLIRALLYLQSGQPAINAKIYKLLRCEPLTPYDSRVLGGMTSRDREDDPLRMLQSLAVLIQAVGNGSFVICFDQLEEIHSMDQAEQRFRQAIQTAITLAEIPNVVVVISCLDDLYSLLKATLPKSHIDRLEIDPTPVSLRARRAATEVKQIISRRLQHLYELTEIEASDTDIYPLPADTTTALTGLTTRAVLDWCRQQREESMATGRLPTLEPIDPNKPELLLAHTELNQYWNSHLSDTVELPDSDFALLVLLGESIERCGQELGSGGQFSVSSSGSDYLTANISLSAGNQTESLLLGLCQKSAKGGALAKQIQQLEKKSGSRTPVALRTTEFPSNPKTKVAKQIGEFIARGGRRAQVADSDWRTMLAIQSFERTYSHRQDYQTWLRSEQPLSQLPSLKRILALDTFKVEKVPTAAAPSWQPTAPVQTELLPAQPGGLSDRSQAVLPAPDSAIPLGKTRTAAVAPVELPREALVRHAAFLGGSGSGKTTLALTLIEQLLLRGIPAILLDRKGDLCSYASPDAWNQPSDNLAYRRLLREQIDVSVYTPGTVGGQGRPLSIAITPPGLGQLPSGERQKIANYCATALGGVMGYKSSGLDKTRLAVLGQAISVLSTLQTENPLSIDRLIEFIAEQDPLLVNAIGVLDPKHCKKLAEDLQTLSLMSGNLFEAQHEQLSVEALLESSKPSKTRLSVINLGTLGDNANVLFWVSQFLLDLNRYAKQHPSAQLQAAVLFDEADMFLPAQGKPSTKEPMENLLKRARSAGLGILLATQSPGDLDYKCRDQISSWFVGKVKENTALNKLKPMLSEAKVDITSKLANQQVGEFFAIRAGEVTTLKANMSLVRAEQVPLEKIQELAAGSAKR